MAKNIVEDSAETDIDREQLVKDIDRAMKLKEDVASKNQAAGNFYKTLEERHGYEMRAFKQLVTLKKMSPEKAASWLKTFMAGVEALGLGETPQPDMLDETGADESNKAKSKQRVRKGLELVN